MTLDKLLRGKFLSPLLVAGTLMASAPVYADSSASSSVSRNLQNISQAAELVLERGGNELYPSYNLLLPEVRLGYGLESRLLASADERPPYLPPQYDEKGDQADRASEHSSNNPRSVSNYSKSTETPSYTPVPSGSSRGCGTTCVVVGGIVALGCGYVLTQVLEAQRVAKQIGEPLGQDPTSPVGPTLLGIGTLGGLGLMVYGLSTQ